MLLCERAGVLNLGIEGIMVAGAFAGWLTVYQGGTLWSGVCVAALIGALLGALHGWLTVTLSLSQHVSGLGITLLATSVALPASDTVTLSAAVTPGVVISGIKVPGAGLEL